MLDRQGQHETQSQLLTRQPHPLEYRLLRRRPLKRPQSHQWWSPKKFAEATAAAPAVIPVPVVAATTASDDPRKERVSRASEEARKLFNGEAYDQGVIGSDDREMRRLVGAELASALVGRNADRRERARVAFMKHGYFDDATRDLRTAESENERAAAARRLSFVQDREATPHLVGALGDPSPDVRRAAVEALMDLRDPAAIAPLHSLLQNETDRKVSRNMISQAIEACATGAPAPIAPGVPERTSSAVPDFVPTMPPKPIPPISKLNARSSNYDSPRTAHRTALKRR